MNRRCDGLPQWNRHRIPDLGGDLRFRATPAKANGEPLDASRLEVRNGAIFLRVKVATLLGLEELCTDSHRWFAEAKPAHYVAGSGFVFVPTVGRKISNSSPNAGRILRTEVLEFAKFILRVPQTTEMLSISAGRDGAVSGQGECLRIPAEVKMLSAEDARQFGVQLGHEISDGREVYQCALGRLAEDVIDVSQYEIPASTPSIGRFTGVNPFFGRRK